ncbi:MAG: anti-sigma factor antagonist [Oscillospiraceae bacterium]|jgi:stage II sporulation protein AA (anti-sigma F factor antagonist)|nr:anti-sigma factor antagonist [Oscillospiraceae bacterium]
MILKQHERGLTVLLDGEIDHHASKTIREEIDTAIYETVPDELVLDFSIVSFMDSSGIGLVLGRYKVMHENGGSIVIEGATQPIVKVMKLSGVDKLARIR